MSRRGADPDRLALPGASVVLAGGRASRMGQEKALLDAGGRTILERSLEVLAGAFEDVIVSVGAHGPSAELSSLLERMGGSVRLAVDRAPDLGPLAGVEAALSLLRHRTAFVIAVDFPELSLPLASLLASELAAGPARLGCVPRGAGRLQPAYAVYSRELLPLISARLVAGERRLGALAGFEGVRVIDLDGEAGGEGLRAAGEFRPVSALFVNLNTPGDYEAWRAG